MDARTRCDTGRWPSADVMLIMPFANAGATCRCLARELASSLRILLSITGLWATLYVLGMSNVVESLVLLSYPRPLHPEDGGVQRYGKGPKDLAFLAFYVLVFSFLRQALIVYAIRPLAMRLGIVGERNLERFTEQGYAFLYWGSASLAGLYVMARQPTFWYETEAFWIDYPHDRLRPELKAFYLVQFAYWLHQLLVLTLAIEKPRSDHRELCLHHIVTLWLIGWSYALDFTYIGVAIFFSMDIADTFFAFSKMLNYLHLQRTSEVSFAVFLGVWSYFRHYQNLRILSSIWYEHDKHIPPQMYTYWPRRLWPMKYNIFVPVAALQCLNLFWYGLMWRMIWRMLKGGQVRDTREEGEVDEESD